MRDQSPVLYEQLIDCKCGYFPAQMATHIIANIFTFRIQTKHYPLITYDWMDYSEGLIGSYYILVKSKIILLTF